MCLESEESVYFLAWTFAVNWPSTWLSVPSIQPLVLLSQASFGACVMNVISPSQVFVVGVLRAVPLPVVTTMSSPEFCIPRPSQVMVPSGFMCIVVVSMKRASYFPVISPESFISIVTPFLPTSLMVQLLLLPLISAISSPFIFWLCIMIFLGESRGSYYLNGF